MSKYFMLNYFHIIQLNENYYTLTSWLPWCHPGREGDLLLCERLPYNYAQLYGQLLLERNREFCWSNSCGGYARWQWPLVHLFALRYPMKWHYFDKKQHWSLDNKHSCRQLHTHTSDRSKYSLRKLSLYKNFRYRYYMTKLIWQWNKSKLR